MAWPSTRNSRGLYSLAPAVSAPRSAKPSMAARSKPGTSSGAITSAASVRPQASSSGTDSAPSRTRVLIDPVQHSGHFAALAEAVHAHVGDRSDCSFHSALMRQERFLCTKAIRQPRWTNKMAVGGTRSAGQQMARIHCRATHPALAARSTMRTQTDVKCGIRLASLRRRLRNGRLDSAVLALRYSPAFGKKSCSPPIL